MITTTTREPDDLSGILHINSDLLQSEHAQRAWHTGLLEAKREAMLRARQLERWGRPLLVAVIGVSFLHVWESIAAIRPAFVTDLQLPSEVYHAAAAAFTIAIDLAALYVVAASQTIALAGAKKSRWASGFFLFLTLLLNMAYIGRHAPSLPDELRATLLPLLNIAFILLLPAFIPIAIFAVEAATQRVIAARLKLLVEVRTLEQLTGATPAAAERREHTPAARASRPEQTPTPAVEIRTLEQRTNAAPTQEHAPRPAPTASAMQEHTPAARTTRPMPAPVPTAEIHILEQHAPMREHAPVEPATAPMQEYAPTQQHAPRPAPTAAPMQEHPPRPTPAIVPMQEQMPVEPAHRPTPATEARALEQRTNATPMRKHAPVEPAHRPAPIAEAHTLEQHTGTAPAAPMREQAPRTTPATAPAVQIRTLAQRTSAPPAAAPMREVASAPVQVDAPTPMQPAPHPLRASNVHPTASSEAAAEASPDAPDAAPASIDAGAASNTCDNCGQPLTRSQWLAMRRWGSCKACRSQAA